MQERVQGAGCRIGFRVGCRIGLRVQGAGEGSGCRKGLRVHEVDLSVEHITLQREDWVDVPKAQRSPAPLALQLCTDPPALIREEYQRGLMALSWRPKPETGLDCCIRAVFARQRHSFQRG